MSRNPPFAVVATIAGFARRHGLVLKAAAVVGLAALGFVALHRLLGEVHLAQVVAAFHALGFVQIGGAIALTALSYVMLTLYDVIALRIVGRSLPYRTAALASFTSYTLSHNFGFALLTGGSARYRIYSAAGLETGDIMRVIATAGITFWSGIVVMAATALAVHPATIALGVLTVDPVAQRILGCAILGGALAAILLLPRRQGSIAFFRWRLPRPTGRQAAAQVAIAAADLAAASAALYILVPSASAQDFPLFFLGYALALIAVLVSHVPGGVGVFEAVILATLPDIGQPELLAALIMYRIVYYLLPLAFAIALFAFHERRQFVRPVADALDATQMVMRSVAPLLLSASVFVGGVVLLISGSLPAIPARLQLLRNVVPLPFIEASHIAASLVGTGLLLVAPGLYRRLDGSFLICRALLLGGAAFSIFKGVDYEEAAILLIVAGLLQMSRPAFYRRTALTTAIVSPRAVTALAVALVLSAWIGFFSYKHVSYQQDLWWRFAWDGDASRFMRASFAATVVLAGTAFWRLFGNTRPSAPALTLEPEELASAIGYSTRTEAFLAYAGDKRFLRSASGDAILMYQVQGQSWIVMADPIGSRPEWPELLWRIREMADAEQGRLLLYQLSIEAVPIAIDLGLQLVKYGEEARVPLADFTLDTPAMRSLRQTERRALRAGAVLEIVPAGQVAAILDELRAVSNAWLIAKGHAEKTFSVGRFDDRYIRRFDCAVIRHEGRIVAFANIWATPNREELSIDLMRHDENIPNGTMDFMFVQLMRWGKAHGFRWFTLGLAPLSGLDARRLAPMWSRLGALLYRHGDAFYGFEGLRAYKDKFDPVWEPRYIAGPHGVGLARALVDLQTLVGGGRRSAATTKLALVA